MPVRSRACRSRFGYLSQYDPLSLVGYFPLSYAFCVLGLFSFGDLEFLLYLLSSHFVLISLLFRYASIQCSVFSYNRQFPLSHNLVFLYKDEFRFGTCEKSETTRDCDVSGLIIRELEYAKSKLIGNRSKQDLVFHRQAGSNKTVT